MKNLALRLAVLSDRNLPFDRRKQVERICHFGQVLLEKHEFAMALERFDAALELRQDSAIAWAGRGQVLYAQRRYREALHCLIKASQHFQGKTPILMLAQAKVLCQLSLFEAVVRCCDEVLRLSPRHLRARIYRAYALCRLKCYGEIFPVWLTAPLAPGMVTQSCPLYLRSSEVDSVRA